MTVATATRPIFNPHPRIERVALSNGNFFLVIDDALVEPDRIVELAVTHRDAFRNVDFSAYPGTYLAPPPSLADALADFFAQHARRLFDARRLVTLQCRFSMVTMQPEQLHPFQWFCHSDNQYVAPSQSIQASVLYLFRDAELGGTSFYEPVISAGELARFNHDAATLSGDAFASKYGIAQEYQCGSSRYFTQIGSVPARFNRLIFYDGAMLHSGDITAPGKLSADPASGRLTFNGFFTCRRNAS
jgi:hypothetical protein